MKAFTILMFLLAGNAMAARPDVAVSMVPRGKLHENYGRDFIIKTLSGTKIDIEFTREGKLEEARGLNLNKGDELEPGDGLISLSSAAQTLVSEGQKPEGYWILDEDKEMGWVYEFKNSITISAKTGKVIRKNQ